MNAATFLHDTKRIVTGEGYLKSETVPIRDFNLASTGAELTTTLSTNPGWDNVDTNLNVLSWAADKVIAGAIAVTVPDDYDASQDHFKLMLYAKMSGTTATTTALTATAYKATDSTTDLAPANTDDMTDSFQWLELDISGNSLSAGETIQFVITPEAHATDAIEILALKREYRSCLVYFDGDNR